MARVVFHGAGSVVFTKNLLGDILGMPELADTEIVLYDIDPDRLATAEGMARWANQALGAGAVIHAEGDRRAALSGADFVINMIAVGGHDATLTDFRVPAGFGLRQTIGDTLGVGGMFRALRTIPVMLALGTDMSELCPDAWLLNYTNPMSALIQAYSEASPHRRVVGLCHSIEHTTRQLARLVDMPWEECAFLGAGVNHQSFILRFEHDGNDLYPRLNEVISADADLQRRVRVAVYRRFGYYPSESSEHLAEYLPWFMRDAAALKEYRIVVDDYVRISAENLIEYAQTKSDLALGKPFQFQRSVEYASVIIHAMLTGIPRAIYGTVPNRGLIDNLPADSAVEVPCLVDRNGVQPVRIGSLPPQCAALNRAFLNPVDLTVRGALEHRIDRLRQAILLDPNAGSTLSLDQVDQLLEAMMTAHAGRLDAGLVRALR